MGESFAVLEIGRFDQLFERGIGAEDFVEVVGVVAGLECEGAQRYRNERLLQPTHPLPNEGGSSNGLEDREPSCESRQARALPFEPPKKRANEKAADHVR